MTCVRSGVRGAGAAERDRNTPGFLLFPDRLLVRLLLTAVEARVCAGCALPRRVGDLPSNDSPSRPGSRRRGAGRLRASCTAGASGSSRRSAAFASSCLCKGQRRERGSCRAEGRSWPCRSGGDRGRAEGAHATSPGWLLRPQRGKGANERAFRRSGAACGVRAPIHCKPPAGAVGRWGRPGAGERDIRARWCSASELETTPSALSRCGERNNHYSLSTEHAPSGVAAVLPSSPLHSLSRNNSEYPLNTSSSEHQYRSPTSLVMLEIQPRCLRNSTRAALACSSAT